MHAPGPSLRRARDAHIPRRASGVRDPPTASLRDPDSCAPRGCVGCGPVTRAAL